MVKPLSFKGDKKSKKRKRVAGEADGAVTISSEQAPADIAEDGGEDDSWVTAEASLDVAGPVVFALPSEPPTCIACDANGKVFPSRLENIVQDDLSTAEPHEVRQVWVANRVAGTDNVSFKGHHGRYLSCDKFGILSAQREAISPEESYSCIPSTETPGTFWIQTQRETFLSFSETGSTPELRGDATETSFSTTFRIRMQARFKPRLKANKAEKARERISRKELEDVVGRKLDDDEAKRLKKARREGNYHEAILDQGVRHYATDAPQQSSRALLYTGITAAAGVLGAYAYTTLGGQPAEQAGKGGQPAEQAGKGAPPSKDEAKAIPKQAADASAAFTGGDQGFLSLRLDQVEQINHNTKRFRFELPDPENVSGLKIASALLTKYKGPNDEKPTLRPYTPVSDEDEKGYLDFVIKRYPNGPMSEHLHNMAPDQRLDFKGPLPKYPWEANKHETIALIAGGTGITPMYQLIRAIFKNPEEKTKVSLIFANLTEEDILLKQELQDLENTYPQRFRAFYVLDNPPDGWTQGKGQVTKSLLKTVLPDPKQGEKIKLFVCGPPGMYKAISGAKNSPADQGELTGMLKELGYSKDQVYKF
ncbi:MAG: NADH-cytochrome b5 reductase [Piccolia ochrophora]|nr:MAG: NADH-cytochrome b5 reductase [Piccolia ochrophora]